MIVLSFSILIAKATPENDFLSKEQSTTSATMRGASYDSTLRGHLRQASGNVSLGYSCLAETAPNYEIALSVLATYPTIATERGQNHTKPHPFLVTGLTDS